MIKLLLEPVNLLILDEPTNHLDMKTKDILKQAIRDFDGTVIVVSHDREFLDGLVSKVYEFGGGEVRECLGGIYDFLEKKRISSLAELELSTRVTEATTRTAKETPRKDSPKPEGSTPKLSYAEQREREKALRRARKRVEDAEAAVGCAEEAVKAVEARISAGESAPEIFTEHAEATKTLENAMSVWELAQIEFDEMNERYKS